MNPRAFKNNARAASDLWVVEFHPFSRSARSYGL